MFQRNCFTRMKSITANYIKNCAFVAFSTFCVSMCGWQVFYISDLYFSYGTSINVHYDHSVLHIPPALSMTFPLEVVTNRTKLQALNSSLEAEIRGLSHRTNSPDNEINMRDVKLVQYMVSKI